MALHPLFPDRIGIKNRFNHTQLPKKKKKALKVTKLTSCRNFRMIQAVIKCFELGSTVGERIALLTFGLKPQVGGIKIVTVWKQSIFRVDWLIATLIFIKSNLIRTLRPKSLEKEEQFKNNLRLIFFSRNKYQTATTV